MKINIEIITIVGLPFYILVLFIQDKITDAICRSDYGLWERVGAPGGWFWCPPNRGAIDNLLKTQRFWFENMFGLKNESFFSERVRKLYKIYYGVAISTLFLFIGFVFTLAYLGLAKLES